MKFSRLKFNNEDNNYVFEKAGTIMYTGNVVGEPFVSNFMNTDLVSVPPSDTGVTLPMTGASSREIDISLYISLQTNVRVGFAYAINTEGRRSFKAGAAFSWDDVIGCVRVRGTMTHHPRLNEISYQPYTRFLFCSINGTHFYVRLAHDEQNNNYYLTVLSADRSLGPSYDSDFAGSIEAYAYDKNGLDENEVRELALNAVSADIVPKILSDESFVSGVEGKTSETFDRKEKELLGSLANQYITR